MTDFYKILVANRGEIAVRVIATARELGYRTVAVYSEADADALHVREADEAVCIGPAAVNESYLVPEKLVSAARLTGADAVHPGYGFLSENTDFAALCAESNITFIGPPAAAIELMGSKRLSKLAMLEAGVPCIPGYQGAEQEEAVLLERAAEVGFPLMVKASAGGGGRGMRLVLSEDELAEQIRTARSEALNAFGSDELILERAVLEPRHIEIQVFADRHGNAVYLGERDCSIQRRHQKVVEEAPSPFVDDALRTAMGEAAVNAARACDYVGAGTVEFLVDADRNFYFLEMNTRLQVEHPVTEMITGQDLVAWQIRVAAGAELPLSQADIRLSGHAVEVRLYAEDPRNGFLPQTGEILSWSYPARDGIRVDHGISTGQVVSPFYDPMIAKLIAWGETREEACRKLASTVQDTVLLGVNSNRYFLQNILRHPVFLAGGATTAFIDLHFGDDDSLRDVTAPLQTLALAAVLIYSHDRDVRQGWHNPVAASHCFRLSVADEMVDVYLREENGQFTVRRGEDTCVLELLARDDHCCAYLLDGVRRTAAYAFSDDALYLDKGEGQFVIRDLTYTPASGSGTAGGGDTRASMDGAIVAVLVAEGDRVEQGQTLVVLEAMKMEHPLKAGMSGLVEQVATRVGDQVKSQQVLVTIIEEEGPA